MLILGCGYCGTWLGQTLHARGWRVFGTTRSAERARALHAAGITPLIVRDPRALPPTLLHSIDAVLDSIPLVGTGDGIRQMQSEWLAYLATHCHRLGWAGYLSTTSVYGDAGGDWVHEASPCHPTSRRGQQRLLAERAWLNSGMPVEIFRLAGIYGPKRNILAKLRSGNYAVVRWDPPHYSNRVHIVDIVAALCTALEHPSPGRILNVADDLPLPHEQYACELASYIGAPAPRILSPQEATKVLSRRALAFFQDSKRIDNARLHTLLPQLHYPTFREGWPSLVHDSEPAGAMTKDMVG
ncbi:MAG: SDR family oxidoreductase [Zetaproteobacteria bacterium]|nr:MAG: SDR family oxidoreductase [Zetaproteobacteria bacterium]